VQERLTVEQLGSAPGITRCVKSNPHNFRAYDNGKTLNPTLCDPGKLKNRYTKIYYLKKIQTA
jgi:hypothetical protein